METILTIIITLAALILVYIVGSTIFFVIGRALLRILTFNKYPGENPDKLQVDITIIVGFLFVFVIIGGFFILRNN